MDISAVGDYYTFGTAVYSWLIIAMNYRVAFITTTWNWISVATIAASLAMYIFFITVYCLWEWFDPHMYMVASHMVGNSIFWLGALAVPGIAMIGDIFKAYLMHEFFPNRVDLVLECAQADKLGDEQVMAEISAGGSSAIPTFGVPNSLTSNS